MLARIRSAITISDLVGAAIDTKSNDIGAVERFERLFAKSFGFSRSLSFAQARGAIYALVKALGWKERDVLIPAYCCAEIAYAIEAAGGSVRFVDSSQDHFLPGPAEWRTATTSSSAAAMLISLFGYPVDKECESIIRSTDPSTFVIYNEAQSYGACDDQGLQARDADAAIFSLGLGKTITSLHGEILLLRNDELYREVKRVRDYSFPAGSLALKFRALVEGVGAWAAFREPILTISELIPRVREHIKPKVRTKVAGANLLPKNAKRLMSDYQARIGLRQFQRLEPILDQRRRIGRYYERRLREEGFRTFAFQHSPNWSRYPFPVSGRDIVALDLHRRGVQIGNFLDYVIPELPRYRNSEFTATIHGGQQVGTHHDKSSHLVRARLPAGGTRGFLVGGTSRSALTSDGLAGYL